MGTSHKKIIGQAYSKIKSRKSNWFIGNLINNSFEKNSVFNSWWVDRGKIKESNLLFYTSVA